LHFQKNGFLSDLKAQTKRAFKGLVLHRRRHTPWNLSLFVITNCKLYNAGDLSAANRLNVFNNSRVRDF